MTIVVHHAAYAARLQVVACQLHSAACDQITRWYIVARKLFQPHVVKMFHSYLASSGSRPNLTVRFDLA